MPLLKSLLCFKGYDNGRRFLAISLVCYSLFLALSSVLVKAPVLLVILLIICSPIILASAMRRVHDGGLATPLAGIPVATYWLCVIGITYVSHGSIWILMVLAVIVTLAFTMLSQPGKRRQTQYQWGYSGPVSFEVEERNNLDNFQRIEPTIAGQHSEADPQYSAERMPITDDLLSNAMVSERVQTNSHSPATSRTESPSAWEDKLQLWVSKNNYLAAGIVVALVLVILVTVFWPYEEVQPVNQPGQTKQAVEEPKERIGKIEMPDNFWIMLDQNDALTVAWQGDIKPDGQVWSALTAKGDKSCFEIEFNRQNKFRVMQVEVKNGGDYYADFSPIDTEVLVESIAKLSRFKLCGYEFSLKGTQAKLMTNNRYRKIIEAMD